MPGREACATLVTIKPTIDRPRLVALLREQFDSPPVRLRPIGTGQLSRAFSFAIAGHSRPYVVRLNASAEGFERDRYAWQTFASAELPIPRIVAIGQVDESFFAISERAPGRTMTALSRAGRRRLLPLALDVLDHIHGQDVRDARGFGYWERPGVGQFASWRDYLASIIEDETTGFHRGWHALFRDSFLEREVYESVYGKMLQLADYCPEDRSLLHGDYGFDNLLTDGKRITGVIDWANVAYGDPLFEIAWLSLFYADPEVDALLRERYESRPDPAPHYAKRIACYQCRIGLDGLRFFARTNQPAAYRSIRNRIVAIAERRATAG